MRKTASSFIIVLAAALLVLFGALTAEAADIALSKTEISAVEGETAKLKLKGAKASKVKWKSSDETVAVVSSKGRVKAVGYGTCKVTAKYKKKTYTCKVEVESLLISEEAIALVRGRQRTLTVNSAKAKPVWNSSNPAVAAVNESGIVQGLTAGVSLITATWKGYTASCYVSVLGISTEALINTGKPKLSNLGRIVLAGSSSMDLWYSAPQAFAPYKVLNMAVGGSKVSDWLKWYPDMIVRYKPSAVVLYVGANDLANGNSVRGADNAQNTIALLNQLSSRLKDVPIYYVGVCPCHIRKGAWQEIAMSNSLVSSYCNVTKNVYYLDLPSKIVRSDGTPDPELFLPDQLHPSTKGYLVWKEHVAGPVKTNLKKSTKKSGKS
jgi:lysophospholipase L1-like esterase